MWLWLISSITGSILGSAADSWFADTRFGGWFYKKTDQLATWTANKLNIKILEDEDYWKTKYPNVSEKMNNLDKRIKVLEDNYIRNLDDGK